MFRGVSKTKGGTAKKQKKRTKPISKALPSPQRRERGASVPAGTFSTPTSRRRLTLEVLQRSPVAQPLTGGANAQLARRATPAFVARLQANSR